MRKEDGLSVILATIGATKLLRYFELDNMLYGPIYSGLETLVRTFDFKTGVPTISYGHFFTILIIFVVYKYHQKFIGYGARFFNNDKKYAVIEIYNNSEIAVFSAYIKHFQQFYGVPKHIEYGNPELVVKSNEYSKSSISFGEMAYYRKPVDGERIYFNDTNFNVSGYYEWAKTEISISKKEDSYTINPPFVKLCIEDNGNADANKYFNDMKSKHEELTFNTITLFHTKVMKVAKEIVYNDYEIYDGTKKSVEELEKIYINSFFHHKKNTLWKIIKQIHFSPIDFFTKLGQSPRIGLLLYGPPGTGKSSFPYRVAMALNRHIVSVDLRSVKNRADVYDIMRTPEIDGVQMLPKDVVYIFDEFNLTIEELYAKKNKKRTIYDEWFTRTRMMGGFHAGYSASNNNQIKKKQETSENDNEETEDDKKTSESQDDYSLDSYGYTDDDLTLEDLLEIIQGPVPLEGAIIIATTNKYEEIAKLCPALFRPGRLTPIHFDNADNWLINEMSKYFFDKELTLDKNISEHNLSPSLLIQLVTEAKTNGDNDEYQYFLKRLLEEIENVKKT